MFFFALCRNNNNLNGLVWLLLSWRDSEKGEREKGEKFNSGLKCRRIVRMVLAKVSVGQRERAAACLTPNWKEKGEKRKREN